MTIPTSTLPSNDAHNSNSDEVILSELSRILVSPQFTGTSRSKRFLEYIVKETLSGRGDDLKGYTIALDVFDKSSNFDSSQNTVVRVQATQVRRRLKLYYADNSDYTGVHISLPKGRYKPIFLTHTSPPVSGRLGDNKHSSNLDYPILEIQPLKNHSEEQSYQSFADSVTTVLIHKLSERDIFQVMQGPTDTQITHLDSNPHEDIDSGQLLPIQIQNQSWTIDSDASERSYILSGFIRRRDKYVRVTVLLASKRDTTYIKTQTFDESFTPDNIFEAPEILAEKILQFIPVPVR